MPKLEQRTVATVTTTREIKLDVRLEKKLRMELKEYARIKKEMEPLETALAVQKETIGKLREKTGEQSIQLDGFKVTEVCGVTNTLDKKKLVLLGCAPAWLVEATVTKPKKPYTLVTLPEEKERGEEE